MPIKTSNSGPMSYQQSPMNTINNNTMPQNTSASVSTTGYYKSPSNDSMGLPEAGSGDGKKNSKNPVVTEKKIVKIPQMMLKQQDLMK